ncbi:Protein CBG26862 [Caenorhabditis briggsae]|uniref:Protein CBG26862 n=1 Tax=Caenorhabditis briggsae TaxID=6238 RepID=B6II62_CAEBR|nr:Protein CBG26862 [Caenorhabditis briggsae]CAR99592.1 Protein CBG26862 [Caenorhabditis briggsae]
MAFNIEILLKRNFLLKFFLLDSGFIPKGNYELNLPNKNYMTFENINYFYSHENLGNPENAVSLVTDFGKAQIDIQEFLFLTALLYWDYGIQGQSQENVNTCKIMRSRIMKELSEYEMKKETQMDSSLRVGEVLLLLNTIQRAIYLIEESRDISIVYNIYGLHYSMYDIMSV